MLHIVYLIGTKVISIKVVGDFLREFATKVKNFNIIIIDNIDKKTINQQVGVNSLNKFHILVVSKGYLEKKYIGK